ncbi:MAG TPA: sulfatase [Candidatus Binatia bacterium]|jgi:arylsulfatase A-like enzyme
MSRPGKHLRLASVAAALLVGAALLCGAALRADVTGVLPARRVVLVSIDTLRPDHLGAYGAPRATSPTLDALAAEGTRFTTCVAPAPWTPPSHVSMLTGLYPSRTGVRGVRDELRPGVHTLAAMLRARGFLTAAVIASDLVLPCARCREDFESVTEIPWRGDGSPSSPVIVDSGVEVTRAAERWLATRAPADRFLLFVHYYDVHSDYRPRPEMARRFGADPGNLEPGDNRWLIDNREHGAVSPAALTQMQRLYDGEIRQLDDVLRGLFAYLRARGLWEGTLVVVTADHGEEFLEHGGLLHGRTLYEELVRVPLILRGPGVPRGRVVRHVASLVDVVPTILAAVGVPPPDALDGRSLLPLVAGDDVRWADRAASEADQTRRKRMVRVGPLKLIRDEAGGDELYDLRDDPGERRNLAAERPREVAELAAAMASMLAGAAPAAPPTLDDDTRARLRALGYLDE